MSQLENPKEDRRRKRTRQMLSDALTALILEKGYDDVLIQDITDKANLSRATFYLHFVNKEDLLMYSLRSVFDGLVEQLGPLSKDDLTWEGAPPSLVAFRHAGENRDLYRVMLRARSMGVILDRIRDYLAQVIRQQIEVAVPQMTFPVPIDVLSQHMGASLLGLITWWLETSAPYSAEQMAQMYHQMNTAAFLYLASNEQTENRV
jgi:AcrR family transcriptional regulator